MWQQRCIPYAVSSASTCFLLVSVKGEDDKTITAGSVVTVTVQLHREPLIDVSFGDNDVADDIIADEPDEKIDEADDEEAPAQVRKESSLESKSERSSFSSIRTCRCCPPNSVVD